MESSGSGPSAPAVAGVVLAGGQSSRMGHSKAHLPIAGEPLLRRVVGRLRAALGDVLVVGPPELAPLVPEVSVIPDTRPGMGPLAGLEAALGAITARCAFVVACDMPFVAPPLVEALAARALAAPDYDVVALRSAHGLEHLHAVYARTCLAPITEALDQGDRSLHGLLARLRVLEVAPAEASAYDPTSLSAFNANTPGDWARALALADAEAAGQQG
jgi:molybdopterin-guanine dinucleotide biosynthesis protein A